MTEPAPPAPQTVPADGLDQPYADTPPAAAAPDRRGGHVRLADVTATVENFFARHPGLDRALMADLGGAVQALERLD
jgi:hypothetical protein